MNIKKNYYSLPEEEFKQFLDSIKNNSNTIHIFKNSETPYYYLPSDSDRKSFLLLNQLQWEYDNLLSSFSAFAKKLIIQWNLIDEIKSTNEIESIYSTRHDIFYLLNHFSKSNNKKLQSIVNSYDMLLSGEPSKKITSHEDVRTIYDQLTLNAIDNEDLPDGNFYRKSNVYITDGLATVHKGFYPEENIKCGMEEFISMLNSDLETYQKLLISHFMIESIHPFYDGNGRLGRFLFSRQLLKDNNTLTALLISKSINDNKSKYYKSLEEARNFHQFGFINEYMEMMSKILIEGFQNSIRSLNEKKKQVESIELSIKLTKAQTTIFALLKEATVFSNFGISAKEIMNYTGLSKRTVMYSLLYFREHDLLDSTDISTFTFHKLNLEKCN